MITHVVFFKLSAPISDNIDLVHSKLLSMQGKIPQLRHLEVGKDILHSERSYDVALITRFDNLDDLQAYQVHPYHADEVLPLMKALCCSVLAVDYKS